MDKETLKKKVSEMSEDERAMLIDVLGIKETSKDIDLVEGYLKLEKRLDSIENALKVAPKKDKGFLAGFFD